MLLIITTFSFYAGVVLHHGHFFSEHWFDSCLVRSLLHPLCFSESIVPSLSMAWPCVSWLLLVESVLPSFRLLFSLTYVESPMTSVIHPTKKTSIKLINYTLPYCKLNNLVHSYQPHNLTIIIPLSDLKTLSLSYLTSGLVATNTPHVSIKHSRGHKLQKNPLC